LKMFGKLKKKIAKVKEKIAEKFTKTEEPQEAAETVPPKQPAPQLEPSPKPQEIQSQVKPKLPEVEPTILPSPKKPKRELKRAVKRLFVKRLSPQDVEDIIWDLEVALLESDVALPVTNHILNRVKAELTERKIGVREDPKKMAEEILRKALEDVLTPSNRVDLFQIINSKKATGEPTVIVFLGINGHGKTTTVAKIAKYLKDRGYKVVLAAADTFRAAGIEQLEIHAQRLGLPVIKQKRGSDAAAVAYDAVAHAKARGADIVLVDTAGRMQTDQNLMDEMRKIVRVTKPDLVIFVGDALTGNDAVEQMRVVGPHFR